MTKLVPPPQDATAQWLYDAWAPVLDTLLHRIDELEKQLATLRTFVFTHRHGYRWEAMGKDFQPMPVTTVGDPVLKHTCNTPHGPTCWCENK